MVDAWKLHYELVDAFTQEWEPRPDLRVTAIAYERTVRLSLGTERPGDEVYRYNWHSTQRNISTMRELAQALLDACDFVEQSNPQWAAHQTKFTAEGLSDDTR